MATPIALALCSILAVCLQLVCGSSVGNATTWTLNETVLTCNESTHHLDIPAGDYDAVLVQGLGNSNVTAVEVCIHRDQRPANNVTRWSTTYCPAAWIMMNDKCMKLISMSSMTRDEAETRCDDMGGVVSHFNVTTHNALLQILLQQTRHGAKWMNNTETNEVTPFRWLSEVTGELVPTWNLTAAGTVCERNALLNVVDQRLGFEVNCTDGSVVSFLRWCDGTEDCPRGEDEFHCETVRRNRPRPNTQKWKIASEHPAWSDADEESFTAWIEVHRPRVNQNTTSSRNGSLTECNEEAVACRGEGNVSCIPQTHVCVYGVEGCPDWSHLSSCTSFECPRMFKCPFSYCVSLDRVCDGGNDCPHGDDEHSCDTICAGQYRCGRRCIPMTAVCDGVIQCEDGDDESFCPRPDGDYCPSGCRCRDTNIQCDSLNETLHVPAVAEFLHISNCEATAFSFLDLSVASRLLSLNASNSSISSLPPSKLVALSDLRTLDLSSNRLRSVQRGWFDGLSSVRVILLKGNLIQTIVPFALSPLRQVSSLDLSGMYIATIQGYTFADMNNLSEIHLSDNMIVSLQKAAFFGTPSLQALYLERNPITWLDAELFESGRQLGILLSEVKELCCATTVTDQCLPAMSVPGFCQRVIPFLGMRILTYTGMAVSLGVGASLLVWLVVKRRHDLLSFHLAAFLLSETAVGAHLLCLLVADSSYGGPFFPKLREWPRSVHCNACGMLAVAGLLGSSGSLVHMAMAYLCKRRLLLFASVVVLFQLSVVPPYFFFFGETFYARLPSCVPGLFFAGTGWWMSLSWVVVIVLFPLPGLVVTVKRWRQEYNLFRGFGVRQIDKKEETLAVLRMLALLAWTALMNVGLGAVWMSEAFQETGAEADGLVWSSLVAIPLRSLLVLLFYVATLAASHRAMD